MREALADEVLDLAAVARAAHDLVHLRRLVEERDGGEVEARDLARGAHAGLDDVLLAERGAERLRGAVELALLDLGALELHEDALVLDRAQAVARGLRDELLLVRRERARPSTRSRARTPRSDPSSMTGIAASARTGHAPA